MQKIGINDFSKLENIDYNNGDIVIISNISEFPKRNNNMLLDMVTVVMCQKGQISVNIEGKLHHISANSVLVLSPNTIIESYLASDDLDIILLCFSLKPLDNNLMLSKSMVQSRLFLKQHPVLRISEDYRREMDLFHSIVPLLRGKENKKYHKEIMEGLLRCLTYVYLSIVEEEMAKENIKDGIADRHDMIFSRFLDILEQNGGKLRHLNKIAAQMSLTPKYLSVAVKKASGKNAQYWVHLTTTKAIVNLLKYSDKSIKEISFEMDFPDLSFFGKFFKKQTGMSPKEYRKNM